MSERNIYGLARSIPEQTKLKVRQRSYFGCIVCGNYIVQYHHLGVGFAGSKFHDADEIVLLCPTHHQQANKKISDNELRAIYKNPFGQSRGYVTDDWTKNNERDILLGNCLFKRSFAPILIYGAPLIWMDRPELPNAPSTISAKIWDSQGDIIGIIDRNVVSIFSQYYDVKSSGKKTTIRRKRGEIVFEFELDSDRLYVRRWHGKTYGAKFDIHHLKGVDIKVPGAAYGGFKLSEGAVEDLSGIAIAERPYLKVGSRPQSAGDIFDLHGVKYGWLGKDARIFDNESNWTGIFDGEFAWDLWPANPSASRAPVANRMEAWRRNLWGSLVKCGEGYNLLVNNASRSLGPIFALGANVITSDNEIYVDNAQIVSTSVTGQIGIFVPNFLGETILVPNNKEDWGETRGSFSNVGGCKTGF